MIGFTAPLKRRIKWVIRAQPFSTAQRTIPIKRKLLIFIALLAPSLKEKKEKTSGAVMRE